MRPLWVNLAALDSRLLRICVGCGVLGVGRGLRGESRREFGRGAGEERVCVEFCFLEGEGGGK